MSPCTLSLRIAFVISIHSPSDQTICNRALIPLLDLVMVAKRADWESARMVFHVAVKHGFLDGTKWYFPALLLTFAFLQEALATVIMRVISLFYTALTTGDTSLFLRYTCKFREDVENSL